MVRGTQSERQRRESRREEEERDENMEEGEGGEEILGGRVKGLKDPIKTAQHLFLQSFMSKRIMPMTLASNLYDKCNQLCGGKSIL